MTDVDEILSTIGVELHDGIGQLLAAIKYRVEAIASESAERASIEQERLKAISELAKTAIDEVRRISHDLGPGVLARSGLTSAMDILLVELEERGLALDVDIGVANDDVSENVQRAIFRITQEAITNICSHASASSVSLGLNKSSTGLSLLIEDDGVGFVQRDQKDGLGLHSMRQRAEATGGVFDVSTAVGTGTKVTVTWRATGKAD